MFIKFSAISKWMRSPTKLEPSFSERKKINYEFPKMETHKHLHVVIKCTK
jgi:hypothetical protein